MTGASNQRAEGVGGARLTASTYARISEIGQPAWDRMAGADNPFLSYAFLDALEDSESCCANTG